MNRELEKLPVKYNLDGSASYVTTGDDVVGRLARRHYGQEWDTTEVVLAANPGLADMGPLLPAGVKIHFPVMTEEQKTASRPAVVNLYD